MIQNDIAVCAGSGATMSEEMLPLESKTNRIANLRDQEVLLGAELAQQGVA